ncbi:MAG: archease [Desulfobulbaceae bacterium]|nr:archease [Desulfobulbaceae bacterium]
MAMPPPPHRIIEHPADTGFETQAPTLASLFENAALVLFALMWEGTATDDRELAITIRGGDLEELMVNFLEEFLYLYDAKELVSSGITIDAISPDELTARVRCHPFGAGRDRELLGVKAITYHQLFVGQTDDGWRARVLLDI